MPDITMCSGLNCPLKETCYRFKAMKKVYGQAYFLSPPYIDSECEYYWKLDKIVCNKIPFSNKGQDWLSIEDKNGGGNGDNEIN